MFKQSVLTKRLRITWCYVIDIKLYYIMLYYRF